MNKNGTVSMFQDLSSLERQSLIKALSNINEPAATISFQNGRIKVHGKSGYIYVLTKENGEYRESYKALEKNKLSHMGKFQTKKGKITSLNASQIFMTAGIIVLLALAINSRKYKDKTVEEEKIVFENIDNSFTYQETEIPQSIIISTEEAPIEIYNEQSIKESKENNIEVDICIEQSSRIIKREETDRVYGETIQKYAKRWGIPTALMSSLITQERDDISKNNPGQLTRMICGEKIILPIIEKSSEDLATQKEVDKIYIVREEPNRDNYTNENEYQEQLLRYKSQLEKSKELKNEGYEIIFFSDLIGEENWEKNIKISTAFLTYYNYKLKNPVLSTFAYNAGYNTAKNANMYDALNGLVGTENTDKKYLNHVFRFLYPYETDSLQVITKPFPDNWEQMTYEERNSYMNEGIKNVELQVTNISINNFREWTNEEEIGSSLRR